MWWLITFICVSVNSQIIHRETHEILYEIAGIFESYEKTQQLAFEESMRQARLDPAEQLSLASAHDGKALQDWRLNPIIIEPSRYDSYSIWRKLCSNTIMRPIVIFGPQIPISDGAVKEQCAIANIPHIQATWKPPLKPDAHQDVIESSEENQEPVFKKISINFYPPSDEILYAYAKLLKLYKWEKFAVLYEDDMGLLRVQKILAHHTDRHPVTVRRLDPNENNFPTFKLLNKFQIYRNIILDCHVDNVLQYLTEARQVQMVTHYQHYILITMDASTVAEKLKNFNSNVTWLSLTNYDTLRNHHLAQRVGKWLGETNNAVRPPVTSFKFEALIMDDIANHILKSLQKVDSIKSNKSRPYDALCDPNLSPWSYGAQLQDEILKTTSTGVSGHIAFNEKGERVNYTLYVNEIYVSELNTVGSWDSATQELTEDRPEDDDLKYKKNSKHFIILSRKTKPFFSDKQCFKNSTDSECEEETADEKYEGFAVELVKEIFDNLRKNKFNYTYTIESYEAKKEVKNNMITRKSYGVLDELLNNKADLVVGDITITEDRKKVVDFSVPFMSLGISILYTKEKEVPPGMFSFLNPYTFEVWMYTATAYCIVSILLFLCSRISPDDWENPQPCDKDPEELENIWNFKNCTWLTMGSIMCQGCDILPKAAGSRWVCGMWWFFAVIVCQTYIAQLSASMTSAIETEPINKVEDLAEQTKVLYGAIINGSTYDFFKNSKDKMYRRMFENMESNPAVFVKSNDEGVKRVQSGKSKYAFFMESTVIEYELRKNCDLKKIGGELDSKDYGIAMPANSPFRTHINKAILELKEAASLDKIKKKWWEDKNKAEKQCEDETVDKNDQEGDLEMKNLIGAFVALIVGLVFCLFITAIEFTNEVRNIVVREQVSHKEVFIKELKASLNFFQLQKPVLRNPSRAPSLASSNGSEKKETRSNVIENFLDFEKEVQ
ncbi:glutamate receptor ionotropic, kainate 2-like isoform X1 [Maniola hyperantus]|uniref:glutamate receptor ionotropic, kainate 2-like isoform X1 n=1 Tax=Aphantopus hyperantus TaxID=2795564 RepID=UPI001569C51F|nr:glutamate receptor ionotropic, kainate 2-like [Maniola hyperantus]